MTRADAEILQKLDALATRVMVLEARLDALVTFLQAAPAPAPDRDAALSQRLREAEAEVEQLTKSLAWANRDWTD